MNDEEYQFDLRSAGKANRVGRLQALGVSIVAMSLLSVAFFLKPVPGGIGTHQQLGLPTCGWILAADLPCPTCGMTTSWSYTVRGNLLAGFMAQPMGMLLALLSIVIAFGGLLTASTGYSFFHILYRFRPSRLFILAGALALLAWGFKILLHKGYL